MPNSASMPKVRGGEDESVGALLAHAAGRAALDIAHALILAGSRLRMVTVDGRRARRPSVGGWTASVAQAARGCQSHLQCRRLQSVPADRLQRCTARSPSEALLAGSGSTARVRTLAGATPCETTCSIASHRTPSCTRRVVFGPATALHLLGRASSGLHAIVGTQRLRGWPNAFDVEVHTAARPADSGVTLTQAGKQLGIGHGIRDGRAGDHRAPR